ncbi:hypothetical protein ABPG72_016795 [Tetrahymena utriculariae]
MGKKAEIKKQVTSVDIFGQNIQLLYQKRPQHLTFFGGLITLANGILLIFVGYQYGAELFLKQNPVTNFSEERIRQPEQYNLTLNTYNMAFGMQDPNTFNQFIDESIYTIKVLRTQMTKVFNESTQQYDQVWSSDDLGPYPCKLSDFKVEGSYSYFQQLSGIDQMYCFDQNNNKASIAGDFEADFYQSIEFFIYQCTNKTAQEAADLIQQGKKVVVCKSQDVIDSMLINGYFAAYYTDKVINPKLRDQPFTTFPRDIFWPTSNKLMKELTMYWRNVYIESDLGIVKQNINVIRDVTFSYSTEQLTYGQSNQFVHLVFRFEKAKQSRYFRQYIKIQDVLAQISGVMNVFLIISSLICQRIAKLDLSQSLVNEVFSFQSAEEEAQERNLQQTKQEKNEKTSKLVRKFTNQFAKSSKFSQNSPQSVASQEQNNFSGQVNQLEEQQKEKQYVNSPSLKRQQSEILSSYIKNYKKEIHIAPNQKEEKEYENLILKLFKASHKVIHLYYYDYFLYYIFPCFRTISRKKKQIKYSQELLNKHLDVMYLINKLQEIDKLKMLLLSEEQIKLFNYLPKPTIRETELFQKCSKNQVGIEKNDNNQSQRDNQFGKTNKFLQIEKFNLLYMDERTEIQKATDAYSAFETLKKYQYRTEIDTKLLMMLDPKILDYFLDEKEVNQFHKTLNTQLQESKIQKQFPNMSQLGAQQLRTRQFSQFALNKEDNEQLNVNQQDYSNVDIQNAPSSYRINQEYMQEDGFFEDQSNINLVTQQFQKNPKNQSQIFNKSLNKQKTIDQLYENTGKSNTNLQEQSQFGKQKEVTKNKNNNSLDHQNQIDIQSDSKTPEDN